MRNTESYVLKKEVDWSLLVDGFTIPLSAHGVFKRIGGRNLQRGEAEIIHFYLNGKSYDARLVNVNFTTSNRGDVLQVRYSKTSEIAQTFQGIFHGTYAYLTELRRRRKKEGRFHASMPEQIKEYLVVYTTEDDDSYLLETIVCEDVVILKRSMEGQSEYLIEAQMEKLETQMRERMTDPEAGYRFSISLTKFRKLDRSIAESLKERYGYRCQICGQPIGEEFGAHVVEAHHIDYFVKSLNNDEDNQMIVCPNHHAIIHEMNPVFDRRRKSYIYKNGREQKLLLNEHL